VASSSLAADVDTGLVIEAKLGAVWSRVLLTGESLDEATLVALAHRRWGVAPSGPCRVRGAGTPVTVWFRPAATRPARRR